MNAEAKTTCPTCLGTGWIFEQKKGREMARPCPCRTSDEFYQKKRLANIPPRFSSNDIELKKFGTRNNEKSLVEAKKAAEKFVKDYPAVADRGILFVGTTGKGKTRLLCSIGNQLIREKNVEVYYIDWNELIREMRSGEDYTSRDFSIIGSLIQKLVSVELLLFDELGASKPSQWVEDNIYFLINRRYNEKKITLFAANFFDKNPEGGETLTDRIGERIRSRLFEMADLIEILGGDYRRDLPY